LPTALVIAVNLSSDRMRGSQFSSCNINLPFRRYGCAPLLHVTGQARPSRRLIRIPLQIRMVAGYRQLVDRKQQLIAEANHPNCLVLQFSFEMIRSAA
jgi:hypothetical protein